MFDQPKKGSMFYKKYTSIALLISLLVTPVFCAKKKGFNSCDYDEDALIEKLFSKKKAKDPEKIYLGINILLHDERFDDDSIAKIVNEKLGYPSFDAILSDFKKTVLYYAAEAGNNRAIDIIFQIWQGKKWKLLSLKETHYGYTPLHIAVINGRIETVKKLLQLSGKNVWKYIQVTEGHGWDTLILAADKNLKQIFTLLLGHAPNDQVKEDLFYQAAHNMVYWFRSWQAANANNNITM